MQTVQKYFILPIIILTILLTTTIIASQITYAQDTEGAVTCGSSVNLGDTTGCQGGRMKAEKEECMKTQSEEFCNNAVKSSTKIENLIKTVINVLSAIVGSVSVIMIIIGGFKYVTSSGDSNNVSSAKNTVMYAIVGLVIVAFAQIIVQFVLERT